MFFFTVLMVQLSKDTITEIPKPGNFRHQSALQYRFMHSTNS
jgi:hypothetical protein